MKKFIFSAALLSLSFLTFSFKSAHIIQGEYDIQTDLTRLNTGLAGTWTASYSKRTDKDVVWSEYHKGYTLTSSEDDLKNLENTLAKF